MNNGTLQNITLYGEAHDGMRLIAYFRDVKELNHFQ